MKRLGRIHAVILEEMKTFTRVGVTSYDLEEYFSEIIGKFKGVRSACKGYKPRGYKSAYPTSLCVAVNEEAIHVPPHSREIREGDLVTIDLVLTDQWVYTDAAISFIVGKNSPARRRRLLDTAIWALHDAISKVKAGVRLGRISFGIYQVVRKAGFDVLKEYGGHGIGTKMWEDPFVANYGHPQEGPVLKEGMVIAIEPLVTAGSDRLVHINEWATKTADGADFVQVEHTVLVTPYGYEILTKA